MGLGLFRELNIGGKDGIKVLDVKTATGIHSADALAGALDAANDLAATTTTATTATTATGGSAIDVVLGGADGTAGVGAVKVGLRDLRAVALEFDIEIVFEGEGDDVLEGEIEFARAQQLIQAIGVADVDGGDVAPGIGLGEATLPPVPVFRLLRKGCRADHEQGAEKADRTSD